MADFSPNPRTEPTIISAYRGPEDHVAQRVVMDMKDRILLYQPEATPLLTLTGKIKGKRKAFNRKHEWLEKDFKPRKVTVSGAQTAVDTSIELVTGDGTKVAARDILKNLRTNELFLVTTMATDTATVVRGIGGAGVIMNDGDVCIILGSSYPDNSTMGTMKSITEYANYNYTQIVRTPFGFTGRDLVTELYGGDDKMNETKWQAIEHKKSLEYFMWFGKRHIIAAAGGVHETTFMGGVDWALQTNVWNLGGTALTERIFNQFLEEALRWGKGGRLNGSGTKYLFCSSAWLTELNQMAINRLQTKVLDSQIGFEASKYVSPHGTVYFVPVPLFDEYHPYAAYLLDLNHIDAVYLRQRDTKLLTGREANDLDGEAYEYFTDGGIEISEEFAHSKLLLQ
jgi:hypothetical protein